MGRMWNRGGDEVERRLRAERSVPSDEFVEQVSGSVRRASTRQVRRYSRVAFASALTVMMLGTFASFGALSYAATGATGTVETVKRIVNGKAPVARKATAASDQYAPKPIVAVVVKKKAPPAPPATGVAPANTQVAATGQLPFTGISLGATVALALGLIGLGVFLRRREGPDSA